MGINVNYNLTGLETVIPGLVRGLVIAFGFYCMHVLSSLLTVNQ